MRLFLLFGLLGALAGQDSSRLELKQITVPYQSADGKTAWLLRAEAATGDRARGRLLLRQITLETREKGVLRMRLQADQGRILDNLKKIDFAGKVTARLLPSGATVTARQGVWSWASKNYLCWGGIELKMRQGEIVGSKVEGNSLNGSYIVR
jgi:hypothetical protein